MKILLYLLGATLFIAWGFYIGLGRAQTLVPLAHFQCEQGICWTTEESVIRIENALKWAAEKLAECKAI